jgi:5-formaminoimidazole-4-carboxamide-1-beta-D-ribofuranosyl 5'-monophosphate synthetase
MDNSRQTLMVPSNSYQVYLTMKVKRFLSPMLGYRQFMVRKMKSYLQIIQFLKEKAVRITTYEDANLMHDLVTGRSSGIIHLLNQTPI